MDRPDPVTEQSTSTIEGDGDRISATVLHFANGLDVVLDHTGITDGEIAIDAVRDGGLSVLDDARVPAARMAPGVVAASGLGDLDVVAVSYVISATGIDLTPAIWEEMANIDGTTPTDDLETAMAYVHQLLVAGRVDDTALRNQLDSAREAAMSCRVTRTQRRASPSTRLASVTRRADRSLLTGAELDQVTAADVLTTRRAGFGGATGWRIVLAGDVDVEQATVLAWPYFGTLDTGTAPGHFVDRLPPFPDGSTRLEVHAGTGDKAALIHTAEAEAADLATSEVLADLLASVLDTRLTDTVREALGASYSPSAYVYVLPTPLSDHPGRD